MQLEMSERNPVTGSRMGMKGQFQNLSRIAYGIGIFAVIVVLMALLLGGLQDQVDDDTTTAEYNATVEALSGLNSLAGWIGTIVVIGVIAAIIGLLRFFGRI